MTAGRLALVGAASAVVFWALKAIAIGVAGGLDKSPLESPLFLAGLVSALVGAGALGAWVLAGRPTWRRDRARIASTSHTSSSRPDSRPVASTTCAPSTPRSTPRQRPSSARASSSAARLVSWVVGFGCDEL